MGRRLICAGIPALAGVPDRVARQSRDSLLVGRNLEDLTTSGDAGPLLHSRGSLPRMSLALSRKNLDGFAGTVNNDLASPAQMSLRPIHFCPPHGCFSTTTVEALLR